MKVFFVVASINKSVAAWIIIHEMNKQGFKTVLGRMVAVGTLQSLQLPLI